MTEKTILIVEAQVLIALDIQRMLEQRNIRNAIFARSADEIDLETLLPDKLELAIIDVSNEEPVTHTLIEALQERDVACILMSSNVRHRQGFGDWQDIPVLIKPVDERELGEAAHRTLARLLP